VCLNLMCHLNKCKRNTADQLLKPCVINLVFSGLPSCGHCIIRFGIRAISIDMPDDSRHQLVKNVVNALENFLAKAINLWTYHCLFQDPVRILKKRAEVSRRSHSSIHPFIWPKKHHFSNPHSENLYFSWLFAYQQFPSNNRNPVTQSNYSKYLLQSCQLNITNFC